MVVPNTMKSISAGVTPAASMARRAAISAEVDGSLAFGGDVPALDAGTSADPLVGGIHLLFEIEVRDDLFRQIGTRAGDT